MTTTDLHFSIEVESVDGSSHAILDSSSDSSVCILSWQWETRHKMLAAVVNLELENAVRFYPKYQENNPFGLGAKLILKFEGIQKFLGFVNTSDPIYGPDQRNLRLQYKDKAGLLVYAGMNERGQTRILRKRMMLTQRKSGSIIFYSPDFSGSATFPWAEDYIVPVFSGSSTDDAVKRIPLSEYETLYEAGGIAFNNATVRYQGDSSSGMPIADVSVWAHVPYYDLSDQTMRISNILKRAFEYPQDSGGLGWIDGSDFSIQATPNDVINRLKWITDENDGYISDLIAWTYDNPAVGLPPSYQIGDFDGQGKVEAKLITQDPLAAKDIQFPTEAGFPSSIANIYSRCVIANKTPNRVDISRDATLNFGSAISIPGTHIIGDSKYVRDYAVRTAFGVYKSGPSKLQDCYPLPLDRDLVRYFFDKAETVDTVALNATFIWTGDETGLPALNDVGDKIYIVYNNMMITVEWTPLALPTENDWYPIHPDLYLAEVDVLGGRNSWLIVEDIDLQNVRGVRLMINSPLFCRTTDQPIDPTKDAFRTMMWFINEFRIYGSGNVTDSNTGKAPELRFVTDSGSGDRYRPDLGDLVINGTFTSSSGWNIGTGWTISTGKANKQTNGTGYLQQDLDIHSGTVYILEYEIEDRTVGSVTPVVGEQSGTTRSSNGIFYEQIIAVDGTDFRFVPTNTSRFRLDNVKLTPALDMYRPKLTNKLAFMGLPQKTLILEVPDVFDFSGSGSVGYKIMGTQLDWCSKENTWEVDIIPQPNLKRGDTVHCSRAGTPYYSVTGIIAGYDGTDSTMRISLVDYETKIEGGE